jgi:hypothetical protein
LGLTRKGARTTGWLDVAHAYETQGEAGLREFLVTRLGRTPKQADDVVDSFSQLTKMMDHINERLQVVGGKPKANLEELGVQRFLSHLGEDLTDEQIAQRLALRFRPEQVQGIMSAAEQAGFVTARQERALERATARGQGRRHRIGRYGPIDFNRVLRGSLRDKFRQGLPVNTDPFDATLRFLQAGSRRIRMTEAVGARGELVDDAAKAMIAEGRDPALFLNIMDNFLDTKYYNRSLRTMAHTMTGFQVVSKMVMGVIANLTQPQNTAYMFGLRGAFKGAMLATQRENRTRVAQGLAIHHSMLKNMGRSIDEEGLVKNAAQKLAEFTLKWTGFNTFEKFNRVHAGLTGYAVVRDSLMRASRGRLRGNNLDWHRRMLRDLGIDLDRTVRDIANVGEEAFFGSAKYQLLEDAAIFRAAQKTQFIPSKMRRPQFWNHPIGRVAFQFKTFALGQGRLLRDTVLTEAAHGNLRPLAYFLSISPIAGEFIVDTRGLIKGRDRDTKGLLRALENSTYAGGFGLATDLLGSARFGNLLGALTGPTINDASDVVERMVQGDVTGIGRLISRTPAFQLTTGILTGGALTTQAITEYLDALGDADEGDSVMNLGDLLQSDAEQK